MIKSKLTAKKIIKIIESHKVDLNKYNVKKIGLFGSFSKGKYGNKSDIDILVDFNKIKFDNYMDLKFLLEKLFKRKVDLVMMNNIKPALRYVKKEAIYARI